MTPAVIAQPVVDQGTVERDNDPLAYVSPSRLKSFLTCRLRFFFEKVLGLPSPSSPNLLIGKAVHEGLQQYYKAMWRGEDASSEEAVLASGRWSMSTPRPWNGRTIIQALACTARGVHSKPSAQHGKEDRNDCAQVFSVGGHDMHGPCATSGARTQTCCSYAVQGLVLGRGTRCTVPR